MTPQQELFDALARLRLKAGQPSYRDIARASGKRVSPSTAHNMLHYKLVPVRWAYLRAVVLALGGEPSTFQPLWQDAFLAEHGMDGRASSDAIVLARAANILAKRGAGGAQQHDGVDMLYAEADRLSKDS